MALSVLGTACSLDGNTSSSTSSASSSSSGGGGASSSSSGGVVACLATGACLDGATCCDSACVDLTRSLDHCGVCGRACGDNQPCLAATCSDATLVNACRASSALLLLDGLEADDRQGQAVGAALVEWCASFVVTLGNISDPAFVSIDTNLPHASAERLVVTMGGPVVNPVVNAYETQRIAPLYFDLDAPATRRVLRRALTQEVVLDIEDSSLTMAHDAFVVETFLDPVDGRMALVAYGLGVVGTEAVGFYLKTILIPAMPAQTQAWMVVEWTDDGTIGVGPGDTFRVMASGN